MTAPVCWYCDGPATSRRPLVTAYDCQVHRVCLRDFHDARPVGGTNKQPRRLKAPPRRTTT